MTRKAIFRTKDEQGNYVPVHLQTSASIVLFNDGENLEEKMGQATDIPVATEEIDGLMPSSDKILLNQLTTELIEKLKTLDLEKFDVIDAQFVQHLEKINELISKDEILETELNQAQANIQTAIDRINSFITENNGITTEINQLKQNISTNKSAIGNLESLSTDSKHSLVLAINEIITKLSNYAQIQDETTSTAQTWSSSKINHELNNKSDRNHEHGLHSINDWRSHLYDKTEVNDLLNALALGFTWKSPVDSLDDLPENPELGWAVIVDERALYVYSEDGWINLGASSLPGNATQEFDGLMSKIDKMKLDSMDADKLAQLDLARFDTIDSQIAQNIESIATLLTKLGVQETTILSIQETLTKHSEQLGFIDFEKLEDILTNIDSETINQLESDLSTLTSTIANVSQSVAGVEEDLNTQKQRLDLLETLPRIFYQTEEPNEAMNGSFWIVAE